MAIGRCESTATNAIVIEDHGIGVDSHCFLHVKCGEDLAMKCNSGQPVLVSLPNKGVALLLPSVVAHGLYKKPRATIITLLAKISCKVENYTSMPVRDDLFSDVLAHEKSLRVVGGQQMLMDVMSQVRKDSSFRLTSEPIDDGFIIHAFGNDAAIVQLQRTLQSTTNFSRERRVNVSSLIVEWCAENESPQSMLKSGFQAKICAIKGCKRYAQRGSVFCCHSCASMSIHTVECDDRQHMLEYQECEESGAADEECDERGADERSVARTYDSFERPILLPQPPPAIISANRDFACWNLPFPQPSSIPGRRTMGMTMILAHNILAPSVDASPEDVCDHWEEVAEWGRGWASAGHLLIGIIEMDQIADAVASLLQASGIFLIPGLPAGYAAMDVYLALGAHLEMRSTAFGLNSPVVFLGSPELKQQAQGTQFVSTRIIDKNFLSFKFSDSPASTLLSKVIRSRMSPDERTLYMITLRMPVFGTISRPWGIDGKGNNYSFICPCFPCDGGKDIYVHQGYHSPAMCGQTQTGAKVCLFVHEGSTEFS